MNTLTFASAVGAALDQVALLRLKTGEFADAAFADIRGKSSNPNTPRVMVPNVHGALGDPRVEQMAYGWPPNSGYPLPDLKGPVKTDVFACFDGNVYTGTPLYPTVFPGKAPWDPPDSRATLRSAQVIMEFAKPRTVAAVGIWEHPDNRPVSAFALEYATHTAPGSYKTLDGDWKLAAEGHDNVDYYHLHAFAQPISARFWRYTILETPCPVQRVAEIELYESALDSMDVDVGAGKGDELTAP